MDPERVEKMLTVIKRNSTSDSLSPKQKRMMMELKHALEELLELKSFHLDLDTLDELEDTREMPNW